MKVILGIVNDLDVSKVGADYIEKLMNLTDFWLFNATLDLPRLGIICHTKYFTHEDHLLKYASENNYDFCIGNWIGHLLRPGRSGSERHVIKDTLKLCKDNTGLVGHLIAHPNKIPYLYKQFWCVDVIKYREFGMPNFELAGLNSFPNFERSAENFHDNYTPFYLLPKPGHVDLEFQIRWGTGLIKAWLEHNQSIMNIPQDIRELKHHLYPENFEKMKLYFESKISVQDLDQPLQKQYFSSIDYESAKNCIFLFNTDRIDFKVPSEKIDTLVAVCAAFRPYLILYRSGFDLKTKVHFIDYSEISLHFKKWLLENWDGHDILSVLKKFESELGSPISWNKPFHDSYEKCYEDVILQFGGIKNWLDFWSQYRKLEHTFTLLDLVTDYDKIQGFLGPGHNYLYFSNSYNTEAGLVKWGKTRLKTSLLGLLEICQSKDVILDGADIDHHYPEPDIQENVVKYYDLG